ncbi:MAG: histidine kinase [Lewinellaceae bacterium]|nr:histidine kinase [Lewinellaceae bacterium]
MRTIWIIFLLAGLSGLAAQTPAYLHYGVRDGLPGNFVHCGLQDRDGLLWFGTDKGLASFDGIRFRVYGVAEGLPDPEVLHIQEDSYGRIWLFCFRKKPCYMLNGRIITEKDDPVLAGIEFQTGTGTLTEEPGSGIWLAESTRQTYRIEQGAVQSVKFPSDVSCFHRIGDAFLAMGLASIMRVTPEGGVEMLHDMKPEYASNPSICIRENRILYAYPNGLVLLEWQDGQIRKLAEKPGLSGQVFADHLGRFWVCSPAHGAVLFDNQTGDLSAPTYFLNDKKVNRVFEDAQHNLWFCTLNEGIFMLQQNAPLLFQNRQDFPSLNIRSLARTAAGHILAGDDAGNVHILHGNAGRHISLGSADGYNLVRQIVPIGHDAFWVASDEGLFRYKAHSQSGETHMAQASLKSVCLQPKQLWIAAGTSLSILDLATQTIHDIITNRFTAVAADATGNIWAGGIDGLYSRQDSFQFNWGDRFPELKNRIMAIKTADNGHIWAVTPRDGLLSVSVNAGMITGVDIVNHRLNTPIFNIQSLYVEPGGRVWLSTNRGIYGVDKAWRVVHFSTADGLADDDVNAVLVHQDTLWAGTVSGLSRLILRQPEETDDFKTLLVGVEYQKDKQTIYRHLIDSTQTTTCLMLPPDASMVELYLSGLDYRHRGNLRFEIVQTERLLPMYCWTLGNILAALSGNSDTSWVESGTFLLGVRVPAGRYQIQVTAVKISGIRSCLPGHLILIKYPNWYETVWFFLSVWGLISFGIWRGYRARLAYREINAAAATLQLQALQSQMSPHFIGNTVNAIQQFLHPPDPEKASEYIALFVRLLRRTMLYSETPIITFEQEIAYLREYLQLVQLRFEDKFQYEILGDDNVLPDTPIPSMLVQPLLENATLHGLAPEGISMLELAFFSTTTACIAW